MVLAVLAGRTTLQVSQFIYSFLDVCVTASQSATGIVPGLQINGWPTCKYSAENKVG